MLAYFSATRKPHQKERTKTQNEESHHCPAWHHCPSFDHRSRRRQADQQRPQGRHLQDRSHNHGQPGRQLDPERDDGRAHQARRPAGQRRHPAHRCGRPQQHERGQSSHRSHDRFAGSRASLQRGRQLQRHRFDEDEDDRQQERRPDELRHGQVRKRARAPGCQARQHRNQRDADRSRRQSEAVIRTGCANHRTSKSPNRKVGAFFFIFIPLVSASLVETFVAHAVVCLQVWQTFFLQIRIRK